MIWRWLPGWLIPDWLRSALLWAAGAAVAVLGIWTAGKRDARQKAEIEQLEADAKANEEMNHADVSRGDSDADARWLRDRAKK